MYKQNIYLISIISIISLILFFFIIKKINKKEVENYQNKLEIEVKDFDKNIIELDKVKYDEPKINDFKPTKTSEFKYFCKAELDKTESSCYRQ